MTGAPSKCFENRSASMVAEVMTSFNSGRRGRSCFRYPSRKSMLRLRSCASSMMSVSYRRSSRSPCVSASRMPSVMILMYERGPTLSVKRHERAALLDLGRGKCHQECRRGAVATRLFATEQALGVACERVDFQVDAVARPKTLERGHGEGVRNQVDLEFGAAHRVHRQAHAVHRDRALARDVAREPTRRAYPKKAIRPRLPQPRDLADPVHMPRDEMAAEPVGHPQRFLEVDFARLV